MIPIFSIIRQNKVIAQELNRAIKEVIEAGIYILGPKVVQFEEAFAKYLGVKYAIGVASGTDALSLALLSLGVERGDEVIIPANAYPTAFAVTAIGAVPKLVDIDPETYNIDSKKIPQAVTQRTKAIIPVHLYGQAADLTSICRYIDKSGKKIAMIEDCCQAHGAEIKFKVQSSKIKDIIKSDKDTSGVPPKAGRGSPAKGGDSPEVEGSEGGWRKVGGIGDVGCFSFYPTKNLGCFGDGGMVVTNNPDIANKVKLLRMYGEEARYRSVMLGRNSRLDELQAAILLVKLNYLDKWNEKRRKIACHYLIYKGSPCKWPWEASYAKHVYHLFVIRAKKRDQLKAYLEKKVIQTAIHYPSPIHFQPSFKYLGYKEGDFPEAEKASREILSLPMFPELEKEEIGMITEAIGKFK